MILGFDTYKKHSHFIVAYLENENNGKNAVNETVFV